MTERDDAVRERSRGRPSSRRRTITHRWDLTPKEAMALQEELRREVVVDDELGEVRRVAGVDVGFEDGGKTTRAAVAVLAWPGLEPVAHALVRRPTSFPYVPGLLSFRELPAILAALDELAPPDLILVDGQGRAHPRRLGIASHLGLLTGIPTIGVAKSRLCGEHGDVPTARGAWTPLVDGDEVIGAVLRTRELVKPVYVSPGHRVDLAAAIAWTMRCAPRYRLPETTRQADRLASGGLAPGRAPGV